MDNRSKIGMAVVIAALAATGGVLADSDHREREGSWFFGWGAPKADIRPLSNPDYENECGSCHFAYQPGLLPARSWQAMMGQLDEHFGENAELDSATNKALTEFLVTNAADKDSFGRQRGFAGSVWDDEVPLRITDTRYFLGKHDEVPLRYVKGNAEVRSFSNCNACHTDAAKGFYDDDGVRIPGVGRWED